MSMAEPLGLDLLFLRGWGTRRSGHQACGFRSRTIEHMGLDARRDGRHRDFDSLVMEKQW